MKTLPIVNFLVEGVQYQTVLLPARTAMPVDRQVVGMLHSAFGQADLGELMKSVKAYKPDAEQKDMDPADPEKKDVDPVVGMKIIGVIAGAIASLSDEEFDKLVTVSLSQTTVIGSTAKDPNILLNPEGIDAHFSGRYSELYMVLFEVWRANQLSPFGVLSRFGSRI